VQARRDPEELSQQKYRLPGMLRPLVFRHLRQVSKYFVFLTSQHDIHHKSEMYRGKNVPVLHTVRQTSLGRSGGTAHILGRHTNTPSMDICFCIIKRRTGTFAGVIPCPIHSHSCRLGCRETYTHNTVALSPSLMKCTRKGLLANMISNAKHQYMLHENTQRVLLSDWASLHCIYTSHHIAASLCAPAMLSLAPLCNPG
jgi:hypothetical protein